MLQKVIQQAKARVKNRRALQLRKAQQRTNRLKQMKFRKRNPSTAHGRHQLQKGQRTGPVIVTRKAA